VNALFRFFDEFIESSETQSQISSPLVGSVSADARLKEVLETVQSSLVGDDASFRMHVCYRMLTAHAWLKFEELAKLPGNTAELEKQFRGVCDALQAKLTSRKEAHASARNLRRLGRIARYFHPDVLGFQHLPDWLAHFQNEYKLDATQLLAVMVRKSWDVLHGSLCGFLEKGWPSGQQSTEQQASLRALF
jgi:hypothetical protein